MEKTKVTVELNTVSGENINTITRRCNSIDLVRIVIALSVVGLHTGELLFDVKSENLVSISVFMEFFFMLSGFFMMKHIDGLRDERETSLGYSLHKIKGFFGALCIANAVQFFIHCNMNDVETIGGVLEKLWHFKWEFLLLQCAGMIRDPQFNQDYLLGPAWYLSAMMIALLIIYPFAKHYRRTFVNIICPVMLIVVYSGMIQKLGYENYGNDFTFIISDAVMRAIAASCAGVICYEVYSRKRDTDMECKSSLAVLDLLCWLSIPFCIFMAFIGLNDSSTFLMIPFAGVIIFAFMDKTPVSQFINSVPSKLSDFLGKVSLYLYLAHMPFLLLSNMLFPDAEAIEKFLFALPCIIAFTAFLYIVDKKRKSSKPVIIICAAALLATFVTATVI